MDAELEFAIQPSTTGKQLFDQVYFLWIKSRVFNNFAVVKASRYCAAVELDAQMFFNLHCEVVELSGL